MAQSVRAALAARPAALSGSHIKAPGFAGGYLLKRRVLALVVRVELREHFFEHPLVLLRAPFEKSFAASWPSGIAKNDVSIVKA